MSFSETLTLAKLCIFFSETLEEDEIKDCAENSNMNEAAYCCQHCNFITSKFSSISGEQLSNSEALVSLPGYLPFHFFSSPQLWTINPGKRNF